MHLGPVWAYGRILQIPKDVLDKLRHRLTIAWLERNGENHTIQANVEGKTHILWHSGDTKDSQVL